MYKVKSELTAAGSGDARVIARCSGMDNNIFVVRGFQMTDLKLSLIVENFLSLNL